MNRKPPAALPSSRAIALLLVVLAQLGPGDARASQPAPAAAMAAAAQRFLAQLGADQRAAASLPFDSPNRFDWHYVPRSRRGAPLSRLTVEERRAAEALLAASLSPRGLEKVRAIAELESVLFTLEGSSYRDPGLFYFTLFGEPGGRGAWGWRYEGHHASLHWTIVDGRIVASTPQFLGANPAEVRAGPRAGTRVLAREEDLARELVRSLSSEQRKLAVTGGSAPSDIVTGNDRRAAIRDWSGIDFDRLAGAQREILLELVREHASTQLPAIAEERSARAEAERESLRFAWMGGLEKGEGHYYRIQGSTFLIEYDNTQNRANHIHCVWRELAGDWGGDLIAEHYRTAPHHAGVRSAERRARASVRAARR